MTPSSVPPVVRLEPELDWSVFERGGTFPGVAFTLDDASIDAYLRVTGEAHPAYDTHGAGLAPPLYTSLVRLVKASIGGAGRAARCSSTSGSRCVARFGAASR